MRQGSAFIASRLGLAVALGTALAGMSWLSVAEARPFGSGPANGPVSYGPGFHQPGFGMHRHRPNGLGAYRPSRYGAWNGRVRHGGAGFRNYSAPLYGWGSPGYWPAGPAYSASVEPAPSEAASVPLPEVPGIRPSPVGAPAIYIIHPAGTGVGSRSSGAKVMTVPTDRGNSASHLQVASDDPSNGPRIIHVSVPAGR